MKSLGLAFLHAHDLSEVRRGTERLVAELGAGLAARGHRLTVISAHRGRREQRTRDGAEVILNRRPPAFGPLRRHSLNHLPLSRRTLGRLRGIDIAHAFHPSDALAALHWAGRTDAPVVFTVPAFPPARPGPLRRRTLRSVFDRVDAVVAPTRAVAGEIRQVFPTAKLEVIAPGVDTEHFNPGGGRSETPVLFCAADLAEPRKRVGFLVGAFAAARQSIPDARLVLADPHPGRRLPSWAQEPGVEVRPMRGDGDLLAAYREAWCAALPAVREPFGLVLTEAMASGTPVLGADADGIPEVIGDGPQGQTVEPDDRDAWIAALTEALATPPSDEVAARARARAEELSLAQCVSHYEALYVRLLQVTQSGSSGGGGS